MRLIVQHRRDITAYATKTTLFDNNEGHTGRRKILLRTAVDDVVLTYIHRTTQNIRTHIGDQRHIAFLAVDLSQLVVVDLRAEDRVIGRDMEIVRVLRDFIIRRNTVCAGCHFHCLAKTICFFECFLAPNTGIEVRCFFLEHVKRHHAEL